jgi:recombination protein RecA
MVKKTSDKPEEKGLTLALNAIKKEYGNGSIFKLSDGELPEIEWLSTGSIKIDRILGKGFARGRIHELYGPESSGKSTLALHLVSEAQKKNIVCAYVDAEHALDIKYATNLGINISDLLLSQPDCGEDALGVVEFLVKSGEVGLIIVDSVAALVPRVELEGSVGDPHMGLQARLMSQAMRMLCGIVSKSNCCVIFINQTRQKMATMGYGPQESNPGGNALKFYASQRVKISRIGKETSGDEKVGINVKVDVVKNKVAPPFKETEVIIRFGTGLDQYNEVIDLAIEEGLIDKSGAWFNYKNEKYQGVDNLITMLKNKPEVFQELYNHVSKNS